MTADGPRNASPGGCADGSWLYRDVCSRLRRRVLAGLLLVLPFVITAWIVLWLYRVLEDYGIRPIARLVVTLVEGRTNGELPWWFANLAAPLIGIVGVVGLLYFLGLVARSRSGRMLDAFLLRVPIVTSIHKAVRQVFTAFGGSGDLTKFQRVVLVEFPHPGMRVPGFVTATCRDAATQKTILCVYVPTTPVPTSGYVLLTPEEHVTDLDWQLEETIQAVVSFGITAPDTVRYFSDGSATSVAARTVVPPQTDVKTMGT